MIQVVGYRDGKPCPLTLCFVGMDAKGRPAHLEKDAARAFLLLCQAAKQAGFTIVINTAWRDHAWQDRLYREWLVSKAAWDASDPAKRGAKPLRPADPGWSKHEAGDAVDVDLVSDRDGGRVTRTWIESNAANFGFVHPIALEPWHYQYDPKQAAKVAA